MQVQIPKSELNSLTEFQKSLHTIHGQEKITSPFYREYIKTTWYSTMLKPLESTKNVNGEIIYKMDPTFHFLMYTYLRLTTTVIKVLPQFKNIVRIAWCHNLGTNIIKTASLKEDDLDFQSFDHTWLDDYNQWFMLNGSGKLENHKIGIGNTPYLEEWTHYLPALPINVDQPWFYGEEPALSYQIHAKTSQSRAEHIYTFRNKISELLRMQKFDGEKWVNINTEEYMNQYLDYGKKNELETPVLWGRYAYVTDDEIKSYKEHPKMQTRDYYIKDVICCDSDNPCQYGTTADITLDCSHPCLGIFWKAENMTATKYNNHSNYTCCIDDLSTGFDPISHITLKYGNKVKLNNMPSDHFNIAESRKHYLSSPYESGYHALSLTWHSDNYNGESGVALTPLNAKLLCKLAHQDLLERDDEEAPEFIIRVRLLYLKKLTILRQHDIFQYLLS
jgi:hypothetical protein